jgi:hypothetical protein
MTSTTPYVIQWPFGALTVQASGGIGGNGTLLTNGSLAWQWAKNGNTAYGTYVSNIVLQARAGTGSLTRTGNTYYMKYPAAGGGNFLPLSGGTMTGDVYFSGAEIYMGTNKIHELSGISFEPTNSTVSADEGNTYFDQDDHVLAFRTDTDAIMQIGLESWARALEDTGQAVSNGHVVYISGGQGDKVKVSLASATNDATGHVLGMATHDFDTGEGFITTFGIVRGLDTSLYSVGERIYLSDQAGMFTNTAGTVSVEIGVVVRSHANDGSVYIHDPVEGFVLKTGDTMTGNLDMQTNDITRIRHLKNGSGTTVINIQDSNMDGDWSISGQWEGGLSATITDVVSVAVTDQFNVRGSVWTNILTDGTGDNSNSQVIVSSKAMSEYVAANGGSGGGGGNPIDARAATNVVNMGANSITNVSDIRVSGFYYGSLSDSDSWIHGLQNGSGIITNWQFRISGTNIIFPTLGP